LSDARWEKASAGWEKVARNYFTLESEENFFLVLQNELYSKGLYAHSPSTYVFDVDKKWTKFSTSLGLRDDAHIQGSARFTIFGDGEILYKSPALRFNQKKMVEIDITNVELLELKTEGTEGHNYNSWAIWANPLIEK
jgi:hypothetical protein